MKQLRTWVAHDNASITDRGLIYAMNTSTLLSMNLSLSDIENADPLLITKLLHIKDAENRREIRIMKEQEK